MIFSLIFQQMKKKMKIINVNNKKRTYNLDFDDMESNPDYYDFDFYEFSDGFCLKVPMLSPNICLQQI